MLAVILVIVIGTCVTVITDANPDLPYPWHISGVRHPATVDSRDCLQASDCR